MRELVLKKRRKNDTRGGVLSIDRSIDRLHMSATPIATTTFVLRLHRLLSLRFSRKERSFFFWFVAIERVYTLIIETHSLRVSWFSRLRVARGSSFASLLYTTSRRSPTLSSLRLSFLERGGIGG